MHSRSEGFLDTSPNPLQTLVRALREEGLAAYIYEEQGVRYLHVSPPRSPAAGTDLRFVTGQGRYLFCTEWGSALSGSLKSIIQRILWWFGKARSTRP